MPWLALLTGPAGRIAGIAGGILAALLLALFLLRQHDGRVRAELLTAQREQQIAALQADHARAVAALESDAATAREAARRAQTLKAAIHEAPASTGCAARPALRAAFDGLRQPADAGAAAPAAGPGLAAGLPATAGAAPANRR